MAKPADGHHRASRIYSASQPKPTDLHSLSSSSVASEVLLLHGLETRASWKAPKSSSSSSIWRCPVCPWWPPPCLCWLKVSSNILSVERYSSLFPAQHPRALTSQQIMAIGYGSAGNNTCCASLIPEFYSWTHSRSNEPALESCLLTAHALWHRQAHILSVASHSSFSLHTHITFTKLKNKKTTNPTRRLSNGPATVNSHDKGFVQTPPRWHWGSKNRNHEALVSCSLLTPWGEVWPTVS